MACGGGKQQMAEETRRSAGRMTSLATGGTGFEGRIGPNAITRLPRRWKASRERVPAPRP